MMLTWNNIINLNARHFDVERMARRPKHPGELIGSILEDIGVSVRTAAAAMHISPTTLSNLITGKVAISPEMAVRLGAYMANGPDADLFWMRLQAEYDLAIARDKVNVKQIKPAPRDAKKR
jgi:addiction module HigA family antidote